MMCRAHYVEYHEQDLIEARKKDPNFGFLTYWIQQQLKKNMNLNVVVVGGPGNGKSVACCIMNKKVDPDFTPSTRTCFNGEEFSTKISEPEKYGLSPGSGIMYEEGGVGMSSRRSQSGGNMSVNVILQTFRYQNLLTTFNVPDLSFIDKQVRRLTHLIIYMKKVTSRGYSIGEIYFVENNHMGGEPRYIKGLYIKNLDSGRTKRYATVRFWTGESRCGIERSKMWKAIIKEYELAATEFKGKLATAQKERFQTSMTDSLGAGAARKTSKSESSRFTQQEKQRTEVFL